MKKFLIISCLLFFPMLTRAASINSIDPIYVTPGETIVTLSGSGFGNSSVGKYIYFDSSSAYSQSWNDTSISVRTPSSIYKSGIIKISGSFKTGEDCYLSYCYDKTEWQEIASQAFYLKPQVTETTKIIHNKGNFEIVGKFFGNTQGTIKINSDYCRVVEWSSTYIKCEVPDLYSNSNVASYSIKVPDSNNYDLTGQVDYLPKISNDTYSYYQTYLKQIKITDVWGKYSGNGIKIAIIDSGIDINNPDLKYSLWVNYGEKLSNNKDDDGNGYKDDYYGYNFIDNNADMSPKNSHGTLVAGIIAASKDNNVGIAGIAPNAKVMSLIACNDSGCPLESIKKAIRYAVDNGANIINLSLGGDGSLGYDPSYDEVIKYAYDKNVLIVASAGNGDTEGNGTRGQDMDVIKSSPICNEDGVNMILGVGAIDKNNKPTVWTNYSVKYVDISAPGVDIFSTAVPIYNDNYWYASESGTSFSAPIVVGVSALLMEKKPLLKNFEIMSQLISRSDNFQDGWNVYGKILNAKNIIESNNPLSELTSVSPRVLDDSSSILHIYGKNFYNNIQIKFYNSQFSGNIPVNLLKVTNNEIQIDFSRWDYIEQLNGVFSISIEGDGSNYGGISKYSLVNSVEIKGVIKKKDNNPITNVTTLNRATVENATKKESTKEYIEKEKKMLKTIDANLSKKLAGKILLQIEGSGEGWYVNPSNNKRYYLGRPADAFNMMRDLGLGINNKTFDSFKGFASKNLSGKILIKVEDSGKAYYVNPDDLKLYYLGRPADAYKVMRELGLGISNNDIRKININ